MLRVSKYHHVLLYPYLFVFFLHHRITHVFFQRAVGTHTLYSDTFLFFKLSWHTPTVPKLGHTICKEEVDAVNRSHMFP
jgi:hypothetical protein